MSEIPRQQPLEFSPKAREFWGPMVDILQQLDSMFAPYDRDTFQNNPDILKDLLTERGYNQTMLLKAFVRKYLMEQIFGQEHPGIHRSPKNDGLEAIHTMHESLCTLYPAFRRSDLFFSQAFFLNAAFWDPVSELLIHMYLHQGNKHADRAFQHLRDSQSGDVFVSLLAMIPSTRRFFTEHGIPLHEIRDIPLEDMEKMNAQLYEVVSQNKVYPVPLSLCREQDVCSVPIALISDQIPPSSGEYSFCEMEFTLADISLESKFMDPKRLQQARSIHDTTTMWSKKIIIPGRLVPLLLTRRNGNIRGGVISPEGLKLLLGERQYEALRSFLLLRWAQLVMDDETFVRLFSGFVEPDEGTVQQRPEIRQEARNPPSLSLPDKRPTRLPVRYFPRGVRSHLRQPFMGQKPSEPTGRKLKGRRTDDHRRLLPIGWFPRPEALEKARECSADLLRSFEVVFQIDPTMFQCLTPLLQQRIDNGDRLFTSEEMEAEAHARNIRLQNLERLNGIQKRQYTFVSGHEFGDVPEGVRGMFGHRIRTTTEEKT